LTARKAEVRELDATEIDTEIFGVGTCLRAMFAVKRIDGGSYSPNGGLRTDLNRTFCE
jgi:hypothetical protein